MKNITSSQLWGKNFLIVSGINFLIMFIYYMLLVTIGSYVVTEFLASKSLSGLVAGIMVIGCLFGRFVTGYFIEIMGCRKVLYIGTILFVITMSLYLIAFNLPLLIIIRFISGIAVGIIGTVTGTVIVYIVPIHRRGEGISYFSLSTILAAAFGPFVGILLIQYVPFTTLFYFGIVVGLICFAIGLLLNIHNLNIGNSQPVNKNWFKLSNYIEPKALNIAIVVMIAGMGYAAIQAYISAYAKEINLITAASFFFAVYSIAILISRPFTGRIIDIKGENIIVYPALLILAFGFILLSQAHSALILLLSGILIGLGFGNFQSTAQTIAVKVSPFHKMGQATSTFFILFDLGIGLGPYLLGLLEPYIGFRGIYFLASIISLFCIVAYYFLHGRKTNLAVAIVDK